MTHKNQDSSRKPHAVISFMADRLMDDQAVLRALQAFGVPLPLLPAGLSTGGVNRHTGQTGQAMQTLQTGQSGSRAWLACGLADDGMVLLFTDSGLVMQEPGTLECLLAAACLPYLVYRPHALTDRPCPPE